MLHTEKQSPQWQYAADTLEIKNGQIHIWHIPLCQPQPVVMRLRQLLTADEQQRADKFYLRRDTDHYIVGRGALRSILANYVGLPAAAISIEYGQYGKPVLTNQPIKFNLSHSGDIALLGISKQYEIGVDIEFMRDIRDAEAIVERFFSFNERATFQRTPYAQRRSVFYNGWTRKEAFIKAIGRGLSYPLDAFDVSIGEDESPALLRIADPTMSASQWCLRSFEPEQGYKAAIVSAGNRVSDYQFWQWQ